MFRKKKTANDREAERLEAERLEAEKLRARLSLDRFERAERVGRFVRGDEEGLEGLKRTIASARGAGDAEALQPSKVLATSRVLRTKMRVLEKQLMRELGGDRAKVDKALEEHVTTNYPFLFDEKVRQSKGLEVALKERRAEARAVLRRHLVTMKGMEEARVLARGRGDTREELLGEMESGDSDDSDDESDRILEEFRIMHEVMGRVERFANGFETRRPLSAIRGYASKVVGDLEQGVERAPAPSSKGDISYAARVMGVLGENDGEEHEVL